MEVDMEKEKLTILGKTDKPREMITPDGEEVLELYADMFMMDDEEVEELRTLARILGRGKPKSGE